METTGRVWEPYLTEQDRAHLARTPDRRVGFGTRPALLLIDLYRWVFGDRPQPLVEAIETWPGSCGLAAWDALPSIHSLLSLEREAAISGHYFETLGEHLGFLRAAGFRLVDCFWKRLDLVLIGG